MEPNIDEEPYPVPRSIGSPASVAGPSEDTVDEPGDHDDLPIDIRADTPEPEVERRLRKRRTPRQTGEGVTTRRRSIKLWETPMDEDSVEKSSTSLHTCPICGSVRTGPSSLWQHLISDHGKRLNDVGRWVHCGECDANFACDATWRLHLVKTKCSQSSMSLRWREKKNERESEEEEKEEDEEASLVGLDGRSKRMLNLKKRKIEEGKAPPREKKRKELTEEEQRVRRQHNVVKNRNFMKPRVGWVIVRQATNFRCPACDEHDFPTIPSLVWHQRKAHSMELCHFQSWILCTGCAHEFGSLSSAKEHMKKRGGSETPSCSWSTAELAWQAEEGSDEATRFLAGLPPVLSSLPTVSPVSPGIKLEPIDEDAEQFGGNTQLSKSAKPRGINRRVDKSYMRPRTGHVIVRRQTDLVCQMCGEFGYATCSSLDHHMRKVHRAGIHQAGMWMHCARCAADFSNISSVRDHVAAGEAGGVEAMNTSCNWDHIYMCWHEMESTEEASRVKQELFELGEVGGVSDQPSTSWAIHQSSRDAERHEQLSKSAKKRGINQRVDKSYMRPRAGYVIVRRRTDLVCQMCGEFGYATCPSLDHHMRKVHRAGIHQAGMWMHCARCTADFSNISSVRDHVAAGEAGGAETMNTSCNWDHIYMCWHEMESTEEASRVKQELGKMGEVGGVSDQPSTSWAIQQSSRDAERHEFNFRKLHHKRHRKLFKPPSQAEDGYVIVKKWTDFPCFGCNSRYDSLNTLIYCMQSKHWLSIAGVGAWMECVCGREFASVTSLRGHLKEEGVETACCMETVLLCWQQRVGGRETETPSYPGCDPTDGPSVSPIIKCAPPGALLAHDYARPGVKFVPVTRREEPTRKGNPLDFDADSPLNAVKEEEPDEEGHSIPSEEKNEVNGRGGMRGEKSMEERGGRMTTFDPTRYNEGDRFVIRKSVEMMCKICGMASGSPSELAAHLQMVHVVEMRGATSDWPQLHWLECAVCRGVFHAAAVHERHLYGGEEGRRGSGTRPGTFCSLSDARLCWMEKEERDSGSLHSFNGSTTFRRVNDQFRGAIC